MKTLDKGQDKIRKICDVLKRETLEPAKQEADKIICEAQHRAEQILAEAEKQARKIVEDANKSMEQEKNVFHTSLTQASRQTVEALKQNIEHKLFNDSLQVNLVKHMTNPKVVADMINAIIGAIQSEGLATEISAIIPKTVSADEVNSYLGKDALDRLQGKSVEVGLFAGGAQVKLLDQKLTLDITDKALSDFLKLYLRKDFRKLIFSNFNG